MSFTHTDTCGETLIFESGEIGVILAVVAARVYQIQSEARPPPRGPENLTHTEPLCVGLCCGLLAGQATAERPEQVAYYMEECTALAGLPAHSLLHHRHTESTAKMYLRRK